MAAKSAISRIDWSSLQSKVQPETFAALNAFRKRHADLSKTLGDLKEQSTTIDFAHYQKVLKNKKVATEAQKIFSAFKPAAADLSQQLKVIDDAQKKAIGDAEKTALHIKTEVADLKVLLGHIDNARPIDQLTVDDVAAAYPALDETVAKMVKRGQWRVPGYYERFGEFAVGF